MEVMEHSGCREPFLQGSISNYLGWRNWGLSFNLAYSVGAKIRLLQMYGSNNSAVPAPVMKNLRMFRVCWMLRVTKKRGLPGGMISHMNLPEQFGICMTILMCVLFREII